MLNIGSFLAGIFATVIGISLNHLYTKKRSLNKFYKDKLEDIFNNLYEIESLYMECRQACAAYDFEKYEICKNELRDKHRETYHTIYLYFDDISGLYRNNILPILEHIDELEQVFNKRKISDDLKLERNKLNEFLYEDQTYLLLKNLFYELYKAVKYKINFPTKFVDFESEDMEKIKPYIR